MRNIPTLSTLFAACMLFGGLIDGLPYVYFQLLRWVVCGVCGYRAYFSYTLNKKAWMWVFIYSAVLFNPINPIYLDREIWVVIDVVLAVVLLVSLVGIKVQKKKRLRIIIGDSNAGFIEAVRLILSPVLPEGCELNMQSSMHGEELLKLAEQGRPDLFVFFFNNIMPHPETELPNAKYRVSKNIPVQRQHRRFEKTLELISHIKETYNAPIWIMSAVDGDPPLTDQLEKVSNHYWRAPYSTEEMQVAARKAFKL